MWIQDASLRLAAHLPAEVPNPGSGKKPPGFDKFTDVMGWVKWIALGLCVIALIGAGVSMAMGSRRGDGGEHLQKVGYVLGGVMVISAAVSLIGFLVGQ
ncbi:hypothetical protein PZ938_13205 [Luteipulveratus sp. YIM 133132]|uniref:Conjugal transfer protein TrbC n=1 Tax=Luteipulveratus flavus TaxID=3031728 RepID=A0ABT6C457_9MICO|nr:MULTISPECIES: hypothetical protein [unclassified Luteipulveratus]MDE9366564.1 hypothetical protein [Luteipulveratus sp. YIM 133132]MDF8263515.1 hypothetical protein [Luteipulveratus sp. YIM 133296]